MAVLNQNLRTQYQGFAVDQTVVAGTDPTSAGASLVAAKTNCTVYVTHISVSTTTDNAATLTFQDTADTPVLIAKTKASPGLIQQVWEFGDDGTAITANKALSVVGSAAGLAARVHIEGYYKPSQVFSV